MRGFMVTIIVLGVFGVAGFALYKFLLPLRSPSRDIRQTLPQGTELNSPLDIPTGYKMGIFADLKDASPRALAFSEVGVLHASIPAKGKIVALPDKDRNGVVDAVVDVVTGLDRPHGIAFDRDMLYIAETDDVVRLVYNSGSMTASNPEILFTLPAGGNHYTRTIRIHGDKLYTSIGSSCNVCEETDSKRASIWVSDLNGANLKLFAKGLRNTVFFDFDREGTMWGADMGRDNLGDNLPPDEINKIYEGKDYGWPFCYGKQIRDTKFKAGGNVTYCTGTEASFFDLPAHVAPLGIRFGPDGNLAVAFHGSWNSTVPVGYKVVKLSILGGDITRIEDFITGWFTGDEVLGRPVDLIYDSNGTLFISDDKANVVYNLTK